MVFARFAVGHVRPGGGIHGRAGGIAWSAMPGQRRQASIARPALSGQHSWASIVKANTAGPAFPGHLYAQPALLGWASIARPA